jgi:subtilisin family serine protease
MKQMTIGQLAAGGFSVLAAIAVSAADPVVRPHPRALASTAMVSPLMAFGGRSAAQLRTGPGGKLDATLADLSRHTARVRAGHELEDLHSLSPAAHFIQPGAGAPAMVSIDAVTRGDPQRLKATLESLGLQHAAVFANDVGGWLPVNQITAAAARSEVHSLRAALWRSHALAETSQGDFAQGSASLRATYPALNGAGVTVGILSDSFNCYGVYDQPGSGVPATGAAGYAPNGFATDDATFDESNGYLPATVKVLEEAPCLQYGQPELLPFTDEGRAMMQIVHDVAPGAALAFYSASNTEADFANGISALAAAGATVIADDVLYYDEPFFQDGIVAQAVDTVAANGVVYFAAAGNNGQQSYEDTAPSFTIAGTGQNANETLLSFINGAHSDTALTVTLPALVPGEFIGLVVEWDQPYVTGAPTSPGSTSGIDLCVTGASGYTVVNLDGNAMTCTGATPSGSDSNEVLILGNPANASGNTPANQVVSLIIGLENGTPAPGRIKIVVADGGAGSIIDTTYATNSPTLQGHPGATGAGAVAAAFFPQTPRCGTSPAVLESYSAEGGEPILFDVTGTRLATPVVRQKPDFTGPDGVNTSFFGFFIGQYGITDSSSVAQCQNDASYLNFFGTSAATPHAAGAAALMRQADPALTPAQILQSLRSTAEAMGTSPNFESGYGFLQVDAAMASLPAPAPVVTVTPTSVAGAQSATLSWLAVNSTSCTASGSWSGTQSTSGTKAVAPTTPGTYTYTLTCASAAGSQSSSANLTVTALTGAAPPPSGGGGGGALEAITLLGLAGLLLTRLLQAARGCAPASAFQRRECRQQRLSVR